MKEIEIIEDESNIFGYSASTVEESSFDYFRAFFKEEQINKLKDWLAFHKITEFTVLRNIYIDESNRGIGLGKSLTYQFILQSNGRPILLIASPDEEHFQLIQWYEKLGFQLTPFSCIDGPLMIKYP
jgi:ribosomal protein S18 acetylase RimI-like enzyme